jgi:hypothetical protein
MCTEYCPYVEFGCDSIDVKGVNELGQEELASVICIRQPIGEISARYFKLSFLDMAAAHVSGAAVAARILEPDLESNSRPRMYA